MKTATSKLLAVPIVEYDSTLQNESFAGLVSCALLASVLDRYSLSHYGLLIFVVERKKARQFVPS